MKDVVLLEEINITTACIGDKIEDLRIELYQQCIKKIQGLPYEEVTQPYRLSKFIGSINRAIDLMKLAENELIKSRNS